VVVLSGCASGALLAWPQPANTLQRDQRAMTFLPDVDVVPSFSVPPTPRFGSPAAGKGDDDDLGFVLQLMASHQRFFNVVVFNRLDFD